MKIEILENGKRRCFYIPLSRWILRLILKLAVRPKKASEEIAAPLPEDVRGESGNEDLPENIREGKAEGHILENTGADDGKATERFSESISPKGQGHVSDEAPRKKKTMTAEEKSELISAVCEMLSQLKKFRRRYGRFVLFEASNGDEKIKITI